MQGRLIVFEGGEGAGKTTQLQRLQEWMAGIEWRGVSAVDGGAIAPVCVTREPGGTELGQVLRGIVLGRSPHRIESELSDRAELLLYAADRAQHVEEWLRPRLQQGQIVLCDRYTDSTIAYQGYGRGLDRALIDQLNAIATNGLQSDLTLWLDVEVDIGLARTRQRGAADRMEQSDLAFHQRVRQGFQALAIAHPDRIVPIDAAADPDQVFAQIQQVVSDHFAQWQIPLPQS